MSLSDLKRISEMLIASRKKSVSSGDYISAISDHEQVIKLIGRTLLDCPVNYQGRLEILKTKVQRELKILTDISRELITFPSKGFTGASDVHESKDFVDKDVFRQSVEAEIPQRYSSAAKNNVAPRNENLPSWAAGRENEIRRLTQPSSNVAAINNAPVLVNRKAPIPVVAVKKPVVVVEDPSKVDRMRRERDSLPNRKA